MTAMRHIYCTLLILFFFALEIKAQRYAFDQGSVRLSVSLNYANYGGDLYQPNLTARIASDRATEFAVRSSIAYFFFERLALGIDFTYITFGQNDKNNVVTIFSRTTWSIGPSIAYFFGERQSPIFPFISMSYSYLNSTEQEFERSINIRATGTNFRVSGGMAIMFGKQASLNLEAFYRVDNRKLRGIAQSQSGNVFGLEVGASLFLF
ncbi:MAG: outer membrane beta-barrel protein [Chloroherpetonaceae bacterium]